MKWITVAFVMLVLLFSPKQGHCEQPVKENAFKMLDKVRDAKKKELSSYLERVRKCASRITSDEKMIEFFNIKSSFYELQKSTTPPAKLRRMIEDLKACIQDHYLHNYLLFYDILFINKNGDVFYTIRKEADYHENIFEGKLAETVLSQQLRKAPHEKFIDYQYYAASAEASAFLVEPVMKDNQLAGWFVLQCTVEKINSMFTREEELGETGEMFLVNRDRQMLTDSRFYGETSILKRHLAKDNISSKFLEEKGHKTVTDYRGYRALSSFEVCNVMGTEWLLIAKIDEDEIITEQYRQNQKALRPRLLQYFLEQKPGYCKSVSFDGTLVRVDMDDFHKVSNKEILHTFGISTCTAIIASLPEHFAYMAHLSTFDKVYGGKGTDLIAHVVKRIEHFDIYEYQKRDLQFTVIATHLDSIANIVDALIDDGILLSQIKFMYNPAAKYGKASHDYATGRTVVEWTMEKEDAEEQYQSAAELNAIGDAVKTLVGYE